MKKSEKRALGEARQAEFAKQNRETGLKAQKKAHEIAAKRKATAEKIAERQKAADAMKKLGEAAAKSAVIFDGMNKILAEDERPEIDYPEVLDMTDETYAG